jgi:pSer/pThr/pTyr-binding forkhead associated (FHA) protein
MSEHDLSREVVGIGRHADNDIVLDDRTLSRFHAEIVRQGEDDARWVIVVRGQNGVLLNGERISEQVELQSGDRIELGRYTAVFQAPAPRAAKNGRPAAPPREGRSPAASFEDDELGLGDELEVDIGLEDGGEGEGHTNTKPAASAEEYGLTNAQQDGLTDAAEDAFADHDDEAGFKPTFVVLLNGTEVSRHPISTQELVIGRSKQCDIVISLAGLSRRHARLHRTGKQVFVEDLGSQNGTWVNNVKTAGQHTLQHGDLLNFYDYGVIYLEHDDVAEGASSDDSLLEEQGELTEAGYTDSALDTARAPASPVSPAPAGARAGAGAKSSPAQGSSAAASAKAAWAPTSAPAAGTADKPSSIPTSTPRMSAANVRGAAVGAGGAGVGAFVKNAVVPTIVETPARKGQPSSEDDLGLGERASSLLESDDQGVDSAKAPLAENEDRGEYFDFNELGDGSFLGDDFEEGAAKERNDAPQGGGARPSGSAAPGRAAARALDDEDLEAELAFDDAVNAKGDDEFGDLDPDSGVTGLADKTTVGLDRNALRASVVAGWPTDEDLERALSLTHDAVTVTLDVTMKGKAYAQIPLSETVTRLGSDPRCECALPTASGLRPWHLTVLKVGGSVLVVRANPLARVEMAGKPFDSATIRNGDLVQLGDVALKFRLRR